MQDAWAKQVAVELTMNFKKPVTLSYTAKSSSSSIRGPESKKCFDLSSRFFIPGILTNDMMLRWHEKHTTWGQKRYDMRIQEDQSWLYCAPYVLGSWTVCVWNWWTAPAGSVPGTRQRSSIASPPARCSGHSETADPSQLAGIGETSAMNTKVVTEQSTLHFKLFLSDVSISAPNRIRWQTISTVSCFYDFVLKKKQLLKMTEHTQIPFRQCRKKL